MSPLESTAVLVTGAGGFIGSHLVEELVRIGARVRAFVHYNARGEWGNLELADPKRLREVEVVMGDIQDPFSVHAALADREVVFHLAALIGIPYSYVAPASYVATNVNGTLNVLEAGRRSDVRRIVHTSTSETYGTAQYTPIDEQHPLEGQSPYSASKIAADKLAQSYWRSFATPVATLRPFNTFGPRQSLRAVIPTIIAQALAGDTVRLGSLAPVRDFTFVRDTARAFVALADAENVAGGTFNAGSGTAISIGELVTTVLDLLGSDARVESAEERVRPDNSEVFELLADASSLQETTGWAPQITFRDGLEETIAFVRAQLATLKPHIYAV
jgi:NAD dependent epimerase/dehydratase